MVTLVVATILTKLKKADKDRIKATAHNTKYNDGTKDGDVRTQMNATTSRARSGTMSGAINGAPSRATSGTMGRAMRRTTR